MMTAFWLAAMIAAFFFDVLTLPGAILFGIPAGVVCLGIDAAMSETMAG